MARKRRAVECVSYLDDDPYEEPDEKSLMIDLNVDSNKEVNRQTSNHSEAAAREIKEVNKQTNKQSEVIAQLRLQLFEERLEHKRVLLDIRTLIDQHIAKADVALGREDNKLEVDKDLKEVKVKNVELNQEKTRTESIQKKVETEKLSERKKVREEELFDSVPTTTSRERLCLKDANKSPQLSVSVANCLTENSIEDLDSSDTIDTTHATSTPSLPVSE